MFTIVLPFAVLWTLCTAAKKFDEDFYYRPHNVSRATPSGIAAVRSALTLDWLAAEDNRQREMVAAIESEPLPPMSRVSHSDCIDYARPPTGTIARLMLEMLKNLEGDDGMLIPSLIQALVRAKLLALETSVFENEPDLEALVKTPSAMLGEPHTTFPRILATIWMAVTDPSTVKKHGWCTVNKITTFLSATRPSEIARQMRVVEPILARVRFVMEEFIQHVTPLNMMQKTTTSPVTRKFKPVSTKPKRKESFEAEQYKRPARTHPTMQMRRAMRPSPNVTVPPTPTLGKLPELSEVPEMPTLGPLDIPKELTSRANALQVFSSLLALQLLVLE